MRCRERLRASRHLLSPPPFPHHAASAAASAVAELGGVRRCYAYSPMTEPKKSRFLGIVALAVLSTLLISYVFVVFRFRQWQTLYPAGVLPENIVLGTSRLGPISVGSQFTIYDGGSYFFSDGRPPNQSLRGTAHTLSLASHDTYCLSLSFGIGVDDYNLLVALPK